MRGVIDRCVWPDCDAVARIRGHCRRHYQSFRYREARDARIEYQRSYREARREELREKSLRYYYEHREERIARIAEWQRANPDRVRAYRTSAKAASARRAFHSANRDRVREWKRAWYWRKPEEIADRVALYQMFGPGARSLPAPITDLVLLRRRMKKEARKKWQ